MNDQRVDSPDALLAEIRGEKGVRLENVGSVEIGAMPQPAAPNPHDQLTVEPLKDDRTVQRRADDKFSTSVGGKGWRVIVRGEYYAFAPAGQGKVRKIYELPFNVPAIEGALSLIKTQLLELAGKQNYKDWVNFRTHEIVSALPLSADTPPTNSLQYMDRDRLERHVIEHKVPLVCADYARLEHLRDACIDFQLNPKDFDKREARRQAERAANAELMRMNPDLDPERKKPAAPGDSFLS